MLLLHFNSKKNNEKLLEIFRLPLETCLNFEIDKTANLILESTKLQI